MNDGIEVVRRDSPAAGFGVMADSGGASRGEMQGWVTEEWVYGELRGAA